MVVEPFQRMMLADYFAGVRSSLVIIPKKNGKTTLLGALAIFHLLSTPDADCVIAAASREQAGIMLRQIHGFIRRSPELRKRLDVTQRVISYERLGGTIRVLASDVDTVDGAIPTLALIDELHRHKHPDVYGVLRDGLGPRQGQLITISTAGDDENSPLGVMRAKAYAAPGLERDGAHRYVKTADFTLHEWALEPDADRDDLELVKTANPASWQTVAELRKRQQDPSMMPWQWARFACGIWMAGEESAISEKDWRACADPDSDLPPGTPGVLIGLDLSDKWDTTAFVPIAKIDGRAVVGKPTILVPPQDGTALPHSEKWMVAEELASRVPWLPFRARPDKGRRAAGAADRGRDRGRRDDCVLAGPAPDGVGCGTADDCDWGAQDRASRRPRPERPRTRCRCLLRRGPLEVRQAEAQEAPD